MGCPLCGSFCEKENAESCTIFICEVCGRFQMDCSFSNELYLNEEQKLILRNYYRSLAKNDPKRLIVLTSKNIDNILSNIYYPKNLVEKVDNVLAYFVSKTKTFGQQILISSKEELLTPLFCTSVEELNRIITYLLSEKYLTYPVRTLESPERYIVTMEGLKYYQEYEKRVLRDKNKSRQCFVAMWFNDNAEHEHYKPNMQNVYSVAIKPAIEYEDNFISIKIDNVEHCNDINDEMISQIRKSRFMVADLTGYRGGVYWEAGFAEGLGIPVIYTCHEQWLNSNKDLEIEGVHFDLNHRNMILWNEENLDEFKQKLINRIGATVV
jgi:nucleoside 2-deoxyribosyltransferase